VRLVKRHGADLRYSPAHGWLAWDGRRWRRDETGEAQRRAKETVRAMYAQAARLPEGERQALARWALQSEARPRLEAMLALAESEPEVVVLPGAFDADPWLLNCQNGTLELQTGQLRPHRREDLITRLAPVDYDPDARHGVWERFLADMTGGSPELEQFLHRAARSSLTGDPRDEQLCFGLGPTHSGKSTFFGAIKAALGDYAETADFEIVRVPFEHVVPQERRDPAVTATLHNPQECGAAILTWLVRGCREWRQQGLGVPPVVERPMEAYREAMDPLQEFLADYCVLGPDKKVLSRPLWDAYQRFAQESHGRRPLSRVQLGELLRRRGCEPFTTGTTRGWRGIGLLVEPAP
jgi:phage/plasmid-associated DNA primase